MIKTYVLDTNVLLQSPEALFAFEENNVVIPNAVLEELDDFKKGYDMINVNAREIARKLYALKNENLSLGKTLFDGIKLLSGGTLYIKSFIVDDDNAICLSFPKSWNDKKHDNDILKTCLFLKTQPEYGDIILITKDTFLGIKADSVKIKNEDFRTDSVTNIDEQYTGQIELYAIREDFEEFSKNGELSMNKLFTINCDDDSYQEIFDFKYYPNEFVILHNCEQMKATKLARVSQNKKILQKLYYESSHPFGVTPRNASQIFMQEALMNPVCKNPIVFIKGPAGTAKTFYSLAVGLERTYNSTNNENEYFRKILICRPNRTMDDGELGFLPGTEKEKIDPLMRPIYDNLGILVDSDKESRIKNESCLQGKIQDIFDRQLIDMQAVGYLRGRSIESQWIIIDEAQNLSPTTIKAIITRAGENTKIILCGDPQQIDNQYLTERTNGLSYAIEKMKESSLCSVISTSEKDIVRSELAKEAVKFLN